MSSSAVENERDVEHLLNDDTIAQNRAKND
jgi:hypothetical protein